MINRQRILTLATAGAYERLLEEVLRNGRRIPLRLRLALSQPETLAAASLGLGLRRLSEITWRPGPGAALILRRLLDEQRDDGSFGTIGSTAAALAGLLALNRQVRIVGAGPGRAVPGELAARLRSAIDEARRFLIERQHDGERWIAPGFVGDEIDSVIVFWLLAPFRGEVGALSLDDLYMALEGCGKMHDPDLSPLIASGACALAARAPGIAA